MTEPLIEKYRFFLSVNSWTTDLETCVLKLDRSYTRKYSKQGWFRDTQIIDFWIPAGHDEYITLVDNVLACGFKIDYAMKVTKT